MSSLERIFDETPEKDGGGRRKQLIAVSTVLVMTVVLLSTVAVGLSVVYIAGSDSVGMAETTTTTTTTTSTTTTSTTTTSTTTTTTSSSTSTTSTTTTSTSTTTTLCGIAWEKPCEGPQGAEICGEGTTLGSMGVCQPRAGCVPSKRSGNDGCGAFALNFCRQGTR